MRVGQARDQKGTGGILSGRSGPPRTGPDPQSGERATSKSKSKQQRRAAARPAPSGGEFPVLPVVVGGLLLLVAIGIGIAAMTSGAFKSTSAGSPTKSGVECNSGEQLAVHYHTHLEILNDGQPVNIPAGIGIDNTNNCLYWLHTHDGAGYLHVEAPARVAQRTFTVGSFFDVWGQPLSSQQVATIKLTSGQKVVAFVDGKQYAGDPRSIPLKTHEEIVLEITPPLIDPPPPFTWDQANYPE